MKQFRNTFFVDNWPALALLVVLLLAVTQDERVLLWSQALDDATVGFFQSITQARALELDARSNHPAHAGLFWSCKGSSQPGTQEQVSPTHAE